jgi:hypothetical protein
VIFFGRLRCAEPKLREEGDLDENQLLEAAKVASQALNSLEASGNDDTYNTTYNLSQTLIFQNL